MNDQNGHDPPTSKSDLPPKASGNSQHVDGLAGPTSNISNVTPVPGAPSTSTLADIYDSEAIDPEYRAKSHVVSLAIQEIGMGKYQVRLHCIRKTQKMFR